MLIAGLTIAGLLVGAAVFWLRRPPPDRALQLRPYRRPGVRRLLADLLRPPSITEKISREMLDRGGNHR